MWHDSIYIYIYKHYFNGNITCLNICILNVSLKVTFRCLVLNKSFFYHEQFISVHSLQNGHKMNNKWKREKWC